MLGVILEIDHSCARVAIIYLSSIMGGSLFVSAFAPKYYTAGASAGVYGLFFSHLSMILLNWNEMDRKRFRLLWLTLYVTLDAGSCLYFEFVRYAHFYTNVRQRHNQ